MIIKVTSAISMSKKYRVFEYFRYIDGRYIEACIEAWGFDNIKAINQTVLQANYIIIFGVNLYYNYWSNLKIVVIKRT